MGPDKKSILFAGGKLISIDSSDPAVTTQGFMMTKNADGSWTIQVNAVISKEEAEYVILQYSELKQEPPKTPAQANPNMPYIPGMDDTGKPVIVKLEENSTFFPNFYRDQVGSITLRLNVAMEKTHNAKTQNVAGGQ